MELFNETELWVQYLFNGLMILLPLLAGVAATSASGAVMIRTIKKVYAEWVRPAIDEATDAIPQLIAKKTGRDPKWVAQQLLENLDAIIAVLPEEAKPAAG